jgi:hypothetical protein
LQSIDDIPAAKERRIASIQSGERLAVYDSRNPQLVQKEDVQRQAAIQLQNPRRGWLSQQNMRGLRAGTNPAGVEHLLV